MAGSCCSRGLPLKGMAILLGIIIFGSGIGEGDLIPGKKILEVRKKIKHLKSSAVRRLQSEDGDIIDCIDIYKQPAFDHPALRNHTIQMAPSYDPNIEEATAKANRLQNQDSSMSLASRLWQKSGSCHYGRKKPSSYPPLTRINEDIGSNLQQSNRSVAILLTEGYSYSGVKGDIQVWNPHVESDDEYSTSQVSLKSGPYYDFESVEAGWAVNPSVYGDRKTRLFVYWTADASKKTGCFDLTCPGFVQTSSEIALGAAIYPLSVPSGLPYQITLFIFKDPNTGNWWVQYGEKTNLGYWPPDLFASLRGNAETAQWGGEVYSSKLERPPHTRTAMGNGQFPDYISGDSGCIKRMRVRENSLVLKFPEWVSTYLDEYRCYNAEYIGDYIEDPEFYYGGPGQNPLCP
ncbi:CARBOXYL-TERMINAL PEPTIDASE [Salix viminalis]|uniref:CARBOXYL-TERMINAL PEPTIDASE n=1 Tax=Salix viminalis TaxID=40686 RepID=A0A9Q0ZQW0_SALVM|nr:CARBOXYL-TERMINAL PEPTIDASE [Salix viminalis]